MGAAAALVLPAWSANASFDPVYFKPTYHLPAETTVTFHVIGGGSTSCVTRTNNGETFTIRQNPERKQSRLYVVSSDHCGTRPQAQWTMSFHLPDGRRLEAVVDVKQLGYPKSTAEQLTYENSCHAVTMPCKGGFASVQTPTGSFAVSLPGSFGPVALGPRGAMYCAREGEICHFSGTKQVLYGRDGEYRPKTATGSTPCTTAAFGSDPAPNKQKFCWTQPASP